MGMEYTWRKYRPASYRKTKRKKRVQSLRKKRVKKIRVYARTMIDNPTPAERFLREYLSTRYPFKFKNQRILGHYITDFCCEKLKLVIELDGTSHIGREVYDQRRDAFLVRRGYTVKRYSNEFALQKPDLILKDILEITP